MRMTVALIFWDLEICLCGLTGGPPGAFAISVLARLLVGVLIRGGAYLEFGMLFILFDLRI